MDEAVTFDVDGLLSDLNVLWMIYAKRYAEANGNEYIRGAMNLVSTVERCVIQNRHVKKWEQGTLFDEWGLLK